MVILIIIIQLYYYILYINIIVSCNEYNNIKGKRGTKVECMLDEIYRSFKKKCFVNYSKDKG